MFPSPKEIIDLQRLFIDSLLLTFHKLCPSFTLWSFSIAYGGGVRRKHEQGRVGFVDQLQRKAYGLTGEGDGGRRRDITVGQGEERYSWRLGVWGY